MGNNIEILGFRADVHNVSDVLNRIHDICPQGTIQILRTDGLAGKRHLVHAAMQAILAFKRETNFAQDLGLEICLRASAQRQISRALDILGIKEGKQDLCAVMVDCPAGTDLKLERILGKRDDFALYYSPDVLKKIYKISDVEIDVYNDVQNVLIEKATLLNLEN